MTKYKVTTYSQWTRVFCLLLIVAIGLALIIFLQKNNYITTSDLSSGLILLLTAILAYVLPLIASTGKIEIILGDNGITINYLKQYLFDNKKTLVINWGDIKTWVVEPDPKFELFKVVLKNKNKLSFRHKNSHDKKDEYKKFLIDFESQINSLNTNSDEAIIEYGKTIYETNVGLFLAVLAVIGILFPLLNFVLPPNRQIDYIVFFVMYPSAIFILTQVYRHRINNKNGSS